MSSWIDLSKYGDGKGHNIRKNNIISTVLNTDHQRIECVCVGMIYFVNFSGVSIGTKYIKDQYGKLKEDLEHE